MNPEQFLVYEHLSYDMIATYLLAINVCDKDLDRMCDALTDSIDPLKCRIRIFPNWQFSDFALDNGHYED